MISLYTYRLPLLSPLKSGARTYMDREGILIHYRDNQSDIVGEAAPLPGLSRETLTGTIQTLHSNLGDIDSLLLAVTDIETLSSELDRLQLPPAAAFAVSAIGLQLLSNRTGRALNNLLECKSSDSIEINSVIGISKPEDLIAEIANGYQSGFRTIKLKSGRRPDDLPGILQSMSNQYPDLRFRIDANRSWPPAKAAEYLSQFSGLPVEYCEEPSAFNDPADWERFSTSSDIPLALDETIDSVATLEKLLLNPPSKILIIKPPLFGSIPRLAGTILRNKTPSSDIVFSSMMDSGIGRTVTGFLASMTGSKRLAHGLDTGRFFKHDILPLTFDNGIFHTDTAKGWGVKFENCNKDSLTLLTSYGS